MAGGVGGVLVRQEDRGAEPTGRSRERKRSRLAGSDSRLSRFGNHRAGPMALIPMPCGARLSDIARVSQKMPPLKATPGVTVGITSRRW